MTLKWELRPDDRVPDDEPGWVTAADRAVKACPGHLWELVLEDCESVHLHCQRCPAGVDDLYPDGQELIYYTSDDGRIKIDSGYHNLADEDTPMTIPVVAHVLSERNYWGEYSAELIIEPRGPE